MQIGRKYILPVGMCLSATAAFVLSVCATAYGGISGWVQASSADACYLTVCPEESSPDNVKDIPFVDEECWAQETTRIRLKSGWNNAKGSAPHVAMDCVCACAVAIVPIDAASEGFSREVMGLLYSSAPPP